MTTTLNSFQVLGMHPVEPTEALFQETLEIQWGSDLSGAELEQARAAVLEHFAGLYLIAVQVDPPDADVDWGEVTQPVEDQPESNWQVENAEEILAHSWIPPATFLLPLFASVAASFLYLRRFS